MTDERETVRELLALDACSAWRADVEALGGEELLQGDSQERWALWLGIATLFTRLARMTARTRAAYARRSTLLWEHARLVTGAAEYSEVAGVMGGWKGEAPSLEDCRCLMWVASQLEGDGALRTALVCLRSFVALVPDSDLRGAYATAQSGRTLRTLGRIDEAENAFAVAEEIATRSGDSWLRVRVRLGTGVVLHSRGNYPGARAQFVAALAEASEHRDLLIGAHLGLVLTAQSTNDLDAAFDHGWMALELASGDRELEVEALSLLANLSLEVGHHAAALRASCAALTKKPKRYHRHFLIRAVVSSALGVQNDNLLDEFLPLLQSDVHRTANPWDRAEGLRILGDVFMSRGDSTLAIKHYESSRCLAAEHNFNEIRWHAENGLNNARQLISGRSAEVEPSPRGEEAEPLTRRSRSVLQSLAELQLTAQ